MTNKNDIVELVAKTMESSKSLAGEAVEAVISTISKTLSKGEAVSIAGLGIFEAVKRNARTGRNPLTGETIQIAAKRVAKFRAAKALKDAVK